MGEMKLMTALLSEICNGITNNSLDLNGWRPHFCHLVQATKDLIMEP